MLCSEAMPWHALVCRMKLRQRIYAMLMVVIYITATLLSSLSILTCNHQHHSHEVCTHQESCDCGALSFNHVCCDHHHPVLGDNYTTYLSGQQRGDSRMLTGLFMLLPAVLPVACGELSPVEGEVLCQCYDIGTQPLPPEFISCEALRAPPVLA